MRKKRTKASSPLYDYFKFEPITQSQSEAKYDFDSGKNLLLSGYAGTGKTHIACGLGIEALMNRTVDQIHIFRSAVSSRDIGFLPGTEEQKMEVYEKACRNVFNKLLGRGDAYDNLKDSGLVTFDSTSFQRGVTYENSLVIVEEVQNLSFAEIDNLVTRLHSSSRIIIAGDTRQKDLRQSQSGFSKMVKTISKIPHRFSHIDFTIDDIVRGGLVKDWIIAAEQVHEEE